MWINNVWYSQEQIEWLALLRRFYTREQLEQARKRLAA